MKKGERSANSLSDRKKNEQRKSQKEWTERSDIVRVWANGWASE